MCGHVRRYSRIILRLFISVEWMPSAVTCVTRGFDSCSMSSWYPAVPERRYAKVLQVLRRQVGQDRLVYLVFAEYRLVLPKAQTPQPDHDVHNQRPPSGVAHIMVCPSECVQEASELIIKSRADRFTDIDLCKDDPRAVPKSEWLTCNLLTVPQPDP